MPADLFDTTPLLPVRGWGWAKYRVFYWRDEAHAESKDTPILARECIESDSGIERFVCEENSFPTGANWASWEVIDDNVKSQLKFARHKSFGGTVVIGSGWCR